MARVKRGSIQTWAPITKQTVVNDEMLFGMNIRHSKKFNLYCLSDLRRVFEGISGRRSDFMRPGTQKQLPIHEQLLEASKKAIIYPKGQAKNMKPVYRFKNHPASSVNRAPDHYKKFYVNPIFFAHYLSIFFRNLKYDVLKWFYEKQLKVYPYEEGFQIVVMVYYENYLKIKRYSDPPMKKIVTDYCFLNDIAKKYLLRPDERIQLFRLYYCRVTFWQQTRDFKRVMTYVKTLEETLPIRKRIMKLNKMMKDYYKRKDKDGETMSLQGTSAEFIHPDEIYEDTEQDIEDWGFNNRTLSRI